MDADMKNEKGLGPTRQDKTIERMQQERDSPGANSAGTAGSEQASIDPGQGGGRSTDDAGNSSNDTAARRGDTAAGPLNKRKPSDG
jgi:hypothetical protein